MQLAYETERRASPSDIQLLPVVLGVACDEIIVHRIGHWNSDDRAAEVVIIERKSHREINETLL